METKLHSKDELMKCLVNRLKEELLDVDTYNSLYESLKAHGMHDEAAEIEEIARDEFSHAEAIADMLEEHEYNLDNDQEIMSLWHKARRAFNMD